MSLGRERVLHVAKLAELEVPAAEVEALVAQISRIVDYVAQLDEVPAGEAAAPFLAGPRPRRSARTSRAPCHSPTGRRRSRRSSGTAFSWCRASARWRRSERRGRGGEGGG